MVILGTFFGHVPDVILFFEEGSDEGEGTGRERIPSRLPAQHTEPDLGLDLTTPTLRPEPKSGVGLN